MFQGKIEKDIDINLKEVYFEKALELVNDFKRQFNFIVKDVYEPCKDYKIKISLQNKDEVGWIDSSYCIGFYFNQNVNWIYIGTRSNDIADFTAKYNYLNKLCNKHFALIK